MFICPNDWIPNVKKVGFMSLSLADAKRRKDREEEEDSWLVTPIVDIVIDHE